MKSNFLKIVLKSILVIAFSICAQISNAQNQKVTIKMKDCSVNKLLTEVWKQTGLKFVYNEAHVKNINNIDVDVQDKIVMDFLKEIFSGTKLNCVCENNVIYITLKDRQKQTSSQQQKKVQIKGKVTDTKGIPLPGVTVGIEASSIATVSDINGEYELELNAGEKSVIWFLCLGKKNKSVVSNGKEQVINVKLESDEYSIDDAVIIGYGTKSKKNVTTSISSIKSSDLEKYSTGAPSFDNILGGALKGVMITQNSGEPGSGSAINIRGITSPASGSSNEPLYVIDGIPFFSSGNEDVLNPLLSISPNDIESIDVLKDAGATSIYGSRGANGVIIIKTKTGRRNEEVKISFGYTLSVGNQIKKFKPLNRKEYMSHVDLVVRNTVNAVNNGQLDINSVMSSSGFNSDSAPYPPNLGVEAIMDPNTGEMKMKYDKLNEGAFGKADTDWVKEVSNDNAITNQYVFGIRGGGEFTNYSFSLNATDQEGLFINDNLKRYSGRLSLDSDISDRFKFGGAMNYTYSNRILGRNRSEFENKKTWLIRPDVPVYAKEGGFAPIDGSFSYGTFSNQPNPVAMSNINNKSFATQFIGNTYLEYKILENLKLRGDISIAYFQDKNSVFSPTYAQEDFTSIYGIKPDAMLMNTNSEMVNTSTNIRADYFFNIDLHNFYIMAGLSWDRSYSLGGSYMYSGFPDDYILTNVSSARNNNAYSEDRDNSGLNSIYARISYNFDKKYMAELNFRSDESSKFGPGNKRAYFPSISLGWRINEENFLYDVSWVNDLKLRLSIGKTGSTNIGNFLYKQFFGSNKKYDGKTTISLLSDFPNKDVKWELTTEYNAGFDFSLFDNRLSGSFDIYHRKTNGALALSPISLETGTSNYFSNLMDITNKGIEIEIGGDIIRTSEFVWNSRFNVSLNRNKIDKLNGAYFDPNSIKSYIEGYPPGILKGFLVDKIIQTKKELDELNKDAIKKGHEYYQEANTGVGDYKYKDINGDGKIDFNDKTVIANPEPKFFGGFANSLTYKNWNLSFVFQFSKGATSLSNIYVDADGNLGQSVYRETFGNTWTPENKNARYAMVKAVSTNNVGGNADIHVFETSYLRLKNISLSYNLPHDILDRLNLSNISLFASMSNVWTLTNWPGIDPELISRVAGVMNDDPYPLSKTFSVGIRVAF